MPNQPQVEAATEHVPTREGYDRWAEIYDGEDNPLIALEEPHVAELLGDVAGLDVLDLGCGTGRHTLRMSMAGARVTAVDFSEGMVARASAKSGWNRVRFVRHDLNQPLSLPNAAFDRVASFLVLDHIADPTAFFAECGRLCRKDGFILASTVHPAMLLRGIQARFTDPHTGRETRLASHPYQISDFVMAAVRAGLRIDHLSEHSVDQELTARCPRAGKYLGWPLLLMVRLRPS